MSFQEIKHRIKSNWRIKIALSFILNALFAILYLLPQHFPIFSVTEIQPTDFDRIIPFLPIFVFLYESLYFLMPIAPWLMETKEELKQYSLGIIGMTVIGFCFFFFFPTSCPRPENIQAANPLYYFVTIMDKDLNAFPSLHAAFALFHCACCCAVFHDNKNKFLKVFFWVWALGIILATLFTKQHVVIDIIAGSILGAGMYLFCFKRNELSYIYAKCFCPGLQETGMINDKLWVIRDGIVNFYIIKSAAGLVCIDIGWRKKQVLKEFKKLGLQPEKVSAIFLTHLHWDHAGCLHVFPNAKIYISEKVDRTKLQQRLSPNQTVEPLKEGEVVFNSLKVHAVDSPGHSADSISYIVEDNLLFTGDSVSLKNNVVKPFPGLFNQEAENHKKSIHKLAHLSGIQCLFTAHHGFTCSSENAFAVWRETANRRTS